MNAKDTKRYEKLQADLTRQVKKARARNRDDAKRQSLYIEVRAHTRLKTARLVGQDAHNKHWANIIQFCSAADRDGVTSRDKQLASEIIDLLEDTFMAGHSK